MPLMWTRPTENGIFTMQRRDAVYLHLVPVAGEGVMRYNKPQ